MESRRAGCTLERLIWRVQVHTILVQNKDSTCSKTAAYLINTFLNELKLKKDFYKKWKFGHVTKDKGIAWTYRKKIRNTMS